MLRIGFLHFAFFALLTAGVVRAELPPDLQRIHQRGELVVGVLSENTPPFAYTDDKGQLTGLDIEILRHAADSLGVKLKLVRGEGGYAGVLKQVRDQKVDISCGAIYPTLPRAEEFLFTESYYRVTSMLVANRVERARRARANDLGELLNRPGVSVGVYKDAGTPLAAQRLFPQAVVHAYEHREQLVPDLLAGKITGALVDELETAKWRQSVANLNLYVVMEEDDRFSRPATFALNWRSVHLQQWLNLFLRQLREDGTLPKLIERFLGEAAR